MTEHEYEDWIMAHCPADRSPEELVDRLAIGCIAIIEASAARIGEPIDDVLARFVWNDNEFVTT